MRGQWKLNKLKGQQIQSNFSFQSLSRTHPNFQWNSLVLKSILLSIPTFPSLFLPIPSKQKDLIGSKHDSWASQVVNATEPACQGRRPKGCSFNPWVGKIPWRRVWQPTPVFLPGESHGQRSLVGYSPGGPKELDMTERLRTHTLLI